MPSQLTTRSTCLLPGLMTSSYRQFFLQRINIVLRCPIFSAVFCTAGTTVKWSFMYPCFISSRATVPVKVGTVGDGSGRAVTKHYADGWSVIATNRKWMSRVFRPEVTNNGRQLRSGSREEPINATVMADLSLFHGFYSQIFFYKTRIKWYTRCRRIVRRDSAFICR